MRIGAELREFRPRLVHAGTADEHQPRAGLGQPERDRLADAGIRAGDHRHPAIEPERACRHLPPQNSAGTGTASMSVKVWLSPAIDQMKA